MAAQQQTANIWAQMSYTPPRGPCSQKTSLVSTCACYRFMIHPLKAATSFECDGCGHHASYHKMDNALDEETVRRWKDMETLRDQRHERIVGLIEVDEEVLEVASPKRRKINRLLENEPSNGQFGGNTTAGASSATRCTTRKRANGG